MKNISEIDKNIKVATTIGKDDVVFYNCLEAPFSIHGVTMENGKFRRLPENVAKSVSEGVEYVHTMCSGGRVRFATDSPYIAVSVKMVEAKKMTRMAVNGSAGLDFYADNEYIRSFVPPENIECNYDSVVDMEDKKMRQICINMPLYSCITDLQIGVQEGSKVEAPAPYRVEKPVVFYGSSITQGGCASRAGMSYEALLSRRFGFDFANLGFSGNAKAEDEIIEYIKGLEMSMFVYDYDHNAPDCEHLEKTHEKMYKAIRQAKGDIPIIIMPRPRYTLNDDEKKRREIIIKTYENAVSSGDKNVYFVDNKTLMALCKDEGIVDGCHPTDLGFFSIAQALGDVIEKNNLI